MKRSFAVAALVLVLLALFACAANAAPPDREPLFVKEAYIVWGLNDTMQGFTMDQALHDVMWYSIQEDEYVESSVVAVNAMMTPKGPWIYFICTRLTYLGTDDWAPLDAADVKSEFEWYVFREAGFDKYEAEVVEVYLSELAYSTAETPEYAGR